MNEKKIEFLNKLNQKLQSPDFSGLTAKVRCPDKPRADQSYHHIMYSLHHIDELIRQLKAITDGPTHSVRYAVDVNGCLWLALEGKPSKFIPAHREMCGRGTIAAGNIFFSDDHQNIIKINHQSGDFHPTEDTLAYPLAILTQYAGRYIQNLEVDISHVDRSGAFCTLNLLNFNLDELNQLDCTNALMAANHNLANNVQIFVDEPYQSKRARITVFKEATRPTTPAPEDQNPTFPDSSYHSP